MAEKMFTLDENQKMWNEYFNRLFDEWKKENEEKLSMIQYTDEEKEFYSKKTFGDISSKTITPYKYESKRKRMSIQQYKPIVLQFERFVGKSFNEITAKDIEEFSKITEKKNKLNHLNAFFLYCVSNGIIKNKDKEFLISLLPEIYRELGNIIAYGDKNIK